LTTHSRPYHPVLGVSLKLISVVLFAGMAACVKYLGRDQGIPVGEVVFVRCLVAVLALATLASLSTGLQILKTSNRRLHATRSLTGTVSMFCTFTALTLIPLADFTAISFTTPMFVTLLAMVLLGERIHVFRWSALGIGLLGVLIMIGPHLHFRDSAPLGFFIALGGALMAAQSMISIRSMSSAADSEPAITITFYFMATAMLCSLLTLPYGWIVPTPAQALVMLLAGCFGVGGQLLMTSSYRYAEASTIAPLDYSGIIMAVLLGYFLFDELPGWSTWVGAPLVITSGLIICWREYQLQLQRQQAPLG
jgi:drug/metabolite transporter (DMT)-like permease